MLPQMMLRGGGDAVRLAGCTTDDDVSDLQFDSFLTRIGLLLPVSRLLFYRNDL
jgi:hypothetical protein